MARLITASIKIPRNDINGDKAEIIRRGLAGVLEVSRALPLYNEARTSGGQGTLTNVFEWSQDDLPKGAAIVKIAYPSRSSSIMDVRAWVDLLGDSKIWEVRSRIASEIKGYLSAVGMKIETDELWTIKGHMPVKE